MGLDAKKAGQTTQFIADSLEQAPLPEGPYQEMVTGNFGNGVAEVLLDGYRGVVFKSYTGESTHLLFPHFFKPLHIIAKDLNGDGDLDLKIFGKEGAFTLFNLFQTSPKEKEVVAGKMLEAFRGKKLGGEAQNIAGSYIRTHNPEELADFLFQFLGEGSERLEWEEIDFLYDLEEAAGKMLDSNETTVYFHPFFERLLEIPHTKRSTDLFYHGLSGLVDVTAVAQLLITLPRSLLMEMYKSGQLFSGSSYGDREIGIQNGLLRLSQLNEQAAAELAEQMAVRERWETNFPLLPYPGIEGFLSWLGKAGFQKAASYLNFAIGFPNPGRSLKVLEKLKENHSEILWELIGNGLSMKCLQAIDMVDSVLKRVMASIRRKEGALFFLKYPDLDLLDRVLDLKPSPVELSEFLYHLTMERETVHTTAEAYFPDRIAELAAAVDLLHQKNSEQAVSFLASLSKSNFKRHTAYRFQEARKMKLTWSSLNPTMVYDVLNQQSMDAIVNYFNADEIGPYDIFKSNSAFLTTLKEERPELFPDLFVRMKGPYLDPAIPPEEAARRLESYAGKNFNVGRTFEMIFNSTSLPKDYLISVMEALPEELRDSLHLLDSNVVHNYSLLRHFGREPLRESPASVYTFLVENGYHFDSRDTAIIMEDMVHLGEEEFARVVKIFQNGETVRPMGIENLDNTGLGWLYRGLQRAGATVKIEQLKKLASTYFENLDLLRSLGVDLDLYQIGPFDNPLTAAELVPHAAELKKLPASDLDAIGGITILDRVPYRTLGAHDLFNNIVLFRNYTFEQLEQGLRLKNISLLDEIVTHEVGHANRKDLTQEEFDLFAGVAGYQRVDLYSPEYAARDNREMTSVYHTTIHEEFAEHWTHYKKNGDSLRKKALQLFEKGDVYLALEYLFFKHIPEETKAKEFDDGGQPVMPQTEFTLENFYQKTLRLKDQGGLTPEKAGWVLGRLNDLDIAVRRKQFQGRGI